MRFLVLLAILLVIPVSSSATLPNNFNRAYNGGFEQMTAGWAVFCSGGICPTVVSPGASGTPSAISIVNANGGSYVSQILSAGTTSLVVDFMAKRNGQGTNWGEMSVGIFGSSVLFARIGFVPSGILLYEPGSSGNFHLITAPVDFGWHHYRIIADPSGGVVSLFIDGAQVTTVKSGSAVRTASWVTLYVGDTAGCDCSNEQLGRGGAAPPMTFDEIFVGPKT